eukprot:m.53940 g.53940  ORF g.53940 m.53940 type:complete len:207 (-) comp48671_c0_seq2:85-705(-)
MKALLLLALLALAHESVAITFDLPAVSKKCLKEDVHKDILVVGEYELSPSDDQIVDLEITDSRDHPVYKKVEALKGKFAFTSDDYDTFSICFTNRLRDQKTASRGLFREVTLGLKTGVEARKYDEIARSEKLKPLELELRKLEDLAESVVADFARMKAREQEHRDTNESTNERLLLFSLISMGALLALAIWQVLYLKRYFRQKKLI